MQTDRPEAARDGWSKSPRLLYGTLAVVFLVVLLGSINAWSRAQHATRAEIAQTVANLDAPCRRIVALRLKEHLLREGRPVTRRELDGITGGIASCKDINDQLDGLEDGARLP